MLIARFFDSIHGHWGQQRTGRLLFLLQNADDDHDYTVVPGWKVQDVSSSPDMPQPEILMPVTAPSAQLMPGHWQADWPLSTQPMLFLDAAMLEKLGRLSAKLNNAGPMPPAHKPPSSNSPEALNAGMNSSMSNKWSQATMCRLS